MRMNSSLVKLSPVVSDGFVVMSVAIFRSSELLRFHDAVRYFIISIIFPATPG